MPVPYNSVSIANTFVELFGRENDIEHMKLQKLVYFSYGWWLAHLGLKGDGLTTDNPEIWRHGPVFPDLYQTFKVFGRKPIKVVQSDNPFVEPKMVDSDDEEIRSLVKWIWGRYGHLSSFALSDLTHKNGTPWHRVATENNFKIAFNTEIPANYIYEEFKKLFQSSELVSKSASKVQNGENRQRT